MYDVNEYGIITSPGKFEGEMAYVPYFWDLVLEGFSDEEIWDDDLLISRFKIDTDLVSLFPGSLTVDDVDKALDLWEDGQGFVFGRFATS